RQIDEEAGLLDRIDLLHQLDRTRRSPLIHPGRRDHRLAPRRLAQHVISDGGAIEAVHRLKEENGGVSLARSFRPGTEISFAEGAPLTGKGLDPGTIAPEFGKADAKDTWIIPLEPQACDIATEIRT